MTPMMEQYFEIKNQYKDFLLFYRLGDFYEMFFDDAIVASRAIELTLTGRDCGEAERAPMCGVPFHSVDTYIGKLIEKGFKIAICEQVEDPATAKGIVKREVVRVITPGTLIETNLLSEQKNNYLCALYSARYTLALASRLGMHEYDGILADGLSFGRLLDEERSLYRTSEDMAEETWGKEKHPVQLNPLVFLPSDG